MPLAPAAPLLGHAAYKAAAVAVEYYLPSASLAAILANLAWRNLPEWIRQDVAFSTSATTQQQVDRNTERLSSVIVKIQAWLEEASSSHAQTPVPHLWAALLLYWQLSCQLQNEGQSETKKECCSNNINNNNTSMKRKQAQQPDFCHLQHMLQLATLAYYVDDSEWLQEQLAPAQHEEDDNCCQLPQQQEHQQHSYKLLSTYCPKRPGLVGYYVAENIKDNQIVIAIRGTYSLEELLTDACGQSVSYHEDDHHHHHHHTDTTLEREQPAIEVRARRHDQVVVQEENIEILSGHERIMDHHHHHLILEDNDETYYDHHESSSHVRCHQGILAAAQRLLQQVDPILQQKVLLEPTATNDNPTQTSSCQLILVGHSLGASTASLAAMILRSRYPRLLQQPNKIKVYAFAPPPVMDHDSAIAASLYTTSVVHESDLIARCSLANLRVFLEFLRHFSNTVVTTTGMAPTNPQSTARLLKQLAKGDKGKPLWTGQAVQQALADAERTVELRHPNHLYVPGKLFFLSSNGAASESLSREAGSEKRDDSGSDRSTKSETNTVQYSCQEMDVTAPTLRTIEMNGYRMIGDHTVTAYRAAIDALIRQSEQEHNYL